MEVFFHIKDLLNIVLSSTGVNVLKQDQLIFCYFNTILDGQVEGQASTGGNKIKTNSANLN